MLGNFNTNIEEEGQDELSTLIQNFNQMTLELKNNEYLNKEFVRNFSHELKTPLSAIKGYADLIKDGALTEDSLLEAVLEAGAEEVNDLGEAFEIVSEQCIPD